MTSLADSFLEDFGVDELLDEQEDEAYREDDDIEGSPPLNSLQTDRHGIINHESSSRPLIQLQNHHKVVAATSRIIPDAIQEYLHKRNAPRQALSTLLNSEAYKEYHQAIQTLTQDVYALQQLLDKTNQTLQDIDAEILAVHRLVLFPCTIIFPI